MSSIRSATPDVSALPEKQVHLLDPDGAYPPGPDWFTRVVEPFRKDVGHPEYPCHFGRQALRRRELFVTAVEDRDLRPLADALAAFLDYARPTPQRRQVLAAFFQPEPDVDHAGYDQLFWSTLQYLHDHDTVGWPDVFPTSSNDPAWEFCFDGTAMFIFAAAPSHQLRASRNLGDCMIMLFQPRNVFAGIEGGTPAGIAGRRRVRDRLVKWDEAELHPSMGSYGDPSNFEWRQYFIPDDGSDMHGACPLHIRKED